MRYYVCFFFHIFVCRKYAYIIFRFALKCACCMPSVVSHTAGTCRRHGVPPTMRRHSWYMVSLHCADIDATLWRCIIVSAMSVRRQVPNGQNGTLFNNEFVYNAYHVETQINHYGYVSPSVRERVSLVPKFSPKWIHRKLHMDTSGEISAIKFSCLWRN